MVKKKAFIAGTLLQKLSKKQKALFFEIKYVIFKLQN